MKRLTITVLISFLLMHPVSAQNQEPLVLTLQKAQQLAQENNFELKNQRLDVEIAETQVSQTKAQGLPQINGTLDYQQTILNAFAERTSSEQGTSETPPLQGNYPSFSTNQQNDAQGIALESIGLFFNNIGDAFASRHQSTAAISVNQKLFDGVYLLGLKAAKVYVDLEQAQTEPTERDINKQVEKAYYGALITEKNLAIVRKNIQNLEKLLYETKQIYEEGFVEQLDVDRLALSLSTLKNQEKNLIKLHDFNFDVLKDALKIPLSTKVELSENLESFEEIALSDEVLNQVGNPERWPEFRVFDVQEDLTELDIERYKKGRLPQVDLFVNGSYGYQGNEFIFANGFDNWFPNLIAGLSISVPIFDGHLKDNQIKQAQLELEKIQVSREQLQSNINLQIQNALTTYLNAKSDVENQIENIALAEKIYNTTKIKYQEGVGSSIEMNQAEQDLYQAQQQYINGLYDLLIAKVDLEKALGK